MVDPNTGVVVVGEENPLYQVTRDTYYGDAEPIPPNTSQISGWQVSGQILQGTQSTGAVLGGDLDLGGWLGPLDRHSMSLLVTLMYADQNVQNQDWKELAGPLLAQLFDSEIASAAGITGAVYLGTMIAYSVVYRRYTPIRRRGGPPHVWGRK